MRIITFTYYIIIILLSPCGSGRWRVSRILCILTNIWRRIRDRHHPRRRGTSRGRTTAWTVHTTHTPRWRTYIYMYNISVCACYYIPLFGSGFCLHCGKVVSQVLPAIKTRAATVATAAATFVRSLVLRGICASLITHTHTYIHEVATRIHDCSV